MIRSSELSLHKAGELTLTLQHDIQNTVNNTNGHILSKENTPKKIYRKVSGSKPNEYFFTM
jgi:hypothetical protein